MQVKIVRTRRRKTSVGIGVVAGEVVVRAPMTFPEHKIWSIVEKNRQWIEKQVNRYSLLVNSTKKYVAGERFLWLWQEYPLEVFGGAKNNLELRERRFVATTRVPKQTTKNNSSRTGTDRYRQTIKRLFVKWYKHQGEMLAKKESVLFETKLGKKILAVKVKNVRSYWGKCFRDGTICLSVKLFACPLPIIRYVLAHEVAHLKHPHHQKAFWAEVERLLGQNPKPFRKWLRENQAKINHNL